MASRFILALLLVGFACLCSGADIRKMLEELLSGEYAICMFYRSTAVGSVV